MTPTNFSTLQASVDSLITTVTANRSVVDSAVALLNGQADTIKAAVTKALEADDAADADSIAAATSAIDSAVAAFAASGKKLSDAVLANTPSAPTTPTTESTTGTPTEQPAQPTETTV